MKIVLVAAHAEDHPDVAALAAILSAAMIAVVTVDRPPGAIAFIPCIAALDNAGVARGCFGTSATVDQIQTAAAADGTPLASQASRRDAFDFKARFTQAERIAIRTAAKTTDAVADFMDMLDTAGMTGTQISSVDPLLNDALDLLTQGGLLGTGRKAQILAP